MWSEILTESVKSYMDCKCLNAISIQQSELDVYKRQDVGGRGASMVVSEKPDISTWTVEKPDGTKITIQVNKKDANKY